MQPKERTSTSNTGVVVSSLSSQLAAAAHTDPTAATSPKPATPDSKKDSPTKNLDIVMNTTAATATDGHGSSPGVPLTPRRLSVSNRLSLQMPPRNPLSPVLDPALGYSVARRPRLDFARSCTSLHHSTIAESPDSSPLAISGGYPIPRGNYRPLESPINNNHGHIHPGSSHASSLGSTSMLDYAPSGDDSDSSLDDDLDGDFDLMDAATQSANTPTNPAPIESAASMSLLNHQKARFGTRQNRRASISRPRPMMSPSPIMQPISHSSMMSGGLDFMRRRDSLTLGPSALEYETDRPDPVRRPVSRRGSLLPKTKNFQRIKAALIEESSPIDVEVKREAEITRQIREDEDPQMSPQMSQESRTMESELANLLDDELESGDSGRGVGISFSKQAERHGGFWFGDQMEGISGSPPAYPGQQRTGSDGDIMMHSDSSCVNSPNTVPADMRRLKRRRMDTEERFEPNVFKRRAVSPSLSNSPKLAQSPPVGGNGGGKRLNFQGFSDTHDGLMKMSLQ